jgi:hypothetical protein
MLVKSSQAGIAISLLFFSACAKGPDPWSPRTYETELAHYQRDPLSLPATGEKYYIEGQEDDSFFYHNDALDAEIIITFTCGKYADIGLDVLAEHPRFPMGQTAKVLFEGPVKNPRVDIYHVKAQGIVEGEDRVMDYYVVGENHCVVDLIYLAPQENYEKGIQDFQACLRDMEVLSR